MPYTEYFNAVFTPFNTKFPRDILRHLILCMSAIFGVWRLYWNILAKRLLLLVIQYPFIIQRKENKVYLYWLTFRMFCFSFHIGQLALWRICIGFQLFPLYHSWISGVQLFSVGGGDFIGGASAGNWIVNFNWKVA